MPVAALDLSQFYSFVPLDNSLPCICRRGNGVPKITAGGSRWKTSARPKRVSITLYDGVDPYEMDIPVIFDGWIDGTTVDTQIARMNQWRFPKQTLKEPTKVRITGGVPVKGATWIITNIEWGDGAYWRALGQKTARLRQDATIHVMQYVEEEVLRGIRQFAVSDKVVTVKKGQDINHLSGGDPKSKKAIQKKNGVRDPKTIKKKTGTNIKVPATTQHKNPSVGENRPIFPRQTIFDPADK